MLNKLIKVENLIYLGLLGIIISPLIYFFPEGLSAYREFFRFIFIAIVIGNISLLFFSLEKNNNTSLVLQWPERKFSPAVKYILLVILGASLLGLFGVLANQLFPFLPYPQLQNSLPFLIVFQSIAITLQVLLKSEVIRFSRIIEGALFHHSIEDALIIWYSNNKIWIEAFIISFVIICLLYGSKLFFLSYSTDDYARFLGAKGGFFLSQLSGRWGSDIFSSYVFNNDIHILPYWNTLVALFFYTSSSVLTARIWDITNRLSIILLSLLCLVTPYVAHSLYFNTNTSVPIAIFLAILGFYLFLKHKKHSVFFVFLLTIAISTYQTTLQLLLVIIVGYIFSSYILQPILNKKTKEIVQTVLLAITLIVLSYGLSLFVNETILEAMGTTRGGRLASATELKTLAVYWDRITNIYGTFLKDLPLLYFSNGLSIINKILIIFTGLCSIFILIKKRDEKIKVCAGLLSILSLPIILYLPSITGVVIPLRAHFSIGWFIAFSLIVLAPTNSLIRNLQITLALTVILLSTLYINIFFYNAHRQTQADIFRSNEIVSRIRQLPEYTKEPIKFLILGTKSFRVSGWKWHQDALNTPWSKYRIFKHFTDFSFSRITPEEKASILTKLFISRHVPTFPDKNSIRIIDGVAVLILNMKHIPIKYHSKEIFDRLFHTKKPIHITPEGLQVYFDQKSNILAYKKDNISESDTNLRYFLYVHSQDNAGIINMDFNFFDMGIKTDSGMLILRKLPNSEIKKIQTGQYLSTGRFWDTTFELQ